MVWVWVWAWAASRAGVRAQTLAGVRGRWHRCPLVRAAASSPRALSNQRRSEETGLPSCGATERLLEHREAPRCSATERLPERPQRGHREATESCRAVAPPRGHFEHAAAQSGSAAVSDPSRRASKSQCLLSRDESPTSQVTARGRSAGSSTCRSPTRWPWYSL